LLLTEIGKIRSTFTGHMHAFSRDPAGYVVGDSLYSWRRSSYSVLAITRASTGDN
jgi:hypothetical protein